MQRTRVLTGAQARDVLPRALAVTLSIGALSWLAIALSRPTGGVTIVWIASGVLTGLLLTSPHRRWPLYLACGLLATMTARVLCGDPLSIVVSRSLAGILESAGVAYSLRILVGDSADPSKLSVVSAVSLGSTLLWCTLSALLAASETLVGGGRFEAIFVAWFISHTLGMIIFATLVVVARRQGAALFGRAGRRLKFVRSLGLVAATTLLVFSQSHYPVLFLVYLPLMWAVFRHHFSGVVVGTALIMIIAVGATLLGTGPLFLMQDAPIQNRIYLLQLFLAAACLLALPVAMVLAERGRLRTRLQRSEQDYRVLADYTRDIVVRMRADGRRLYVSPSVKDVLGWEPAELMQPRWDLVHPDDRARVVDEIQTLFQTGEEKTVIYRALHKDGHYVWIEALARRIEVTEPGALPEIVYSGRNITKRMLAEQRLAESEGRVRAIADNVPAMIMRVDTEQRYTFVNAYLGRIFGIEPSSMIGLTIREIVDAELYEQIRPRIEAALRGERITFEGQIEANGQQYYRQANYIPDLRPDGSVSGMYSLTYDITELHRTKQELTRLAQHDPLTGLGNRNKFNERLELALARTRRNDHPLALLYLDIDHFKQINDSHGHAAGDAILCEFAQRLSHCLRETDLAVRLGGDEFAVIVEDIGAPDVPEIIARKLVAAMQAPMLSHGAVLTVTSSVGVGVCRSPTSADALMQLADTALYAAKAAGRNTYRVALAE